MPSVQVLARELKELLVLDWEQITTEPKKWVPLPRTPSVANILEELLESKQKHTVDQKRKWAEVVGALLTYFDKALPKLLLYPTERDQFENHKGAPSAVYGAEHLLRLFTKLPTLLVKTDLGPAEVTQLQAKLGQVLESKSAYCL